MSIENPHIGTHTKCSKLCIVGRDVKLIIGLISSCPAIGEFQGLVGSFIEMVDGLAKQVEREKMKAIGARNLLKSIAKERESQKQQLQALIAEKKMQLER